MIDVHFSNKRQRSMVERIGGPLGIGREPGEGGTRVVLSDPFVSGDQMRVEEVPDDRLRVENRSGKVPIRLADGSTVGPGQVVTVGLPARMTVGETLIEVEKVEEGASDNTSGLSTLDPSELGREAEPFGARIEGLEDASGAAEIARWFETVVAIQRAAATRKEFYEETAEAVVRCVGLDLGLVLLRRGDGWEVAARAPGPGSPGEEASFSRTVLDRMCRDRRTLFQSSNLVDRGASLDGVAALVASPIFGASEEEIVGAVYGVRSPRPGLAVAEVRPLEAQLVQVLAAAVGAGTARLGAEAEASRRLVQFEQFFSPELARHLEADPGLLEGRERVITAMFSDIRGFSAISEALPPREVCALVGDFMDRLTDRIREHGGVVVDYVGDGLLAMWNAPTDQPDHAHLACLAARAMQAELPAINATWAGRIGRPLGLGIGLNTGPALVGNTGSRSRFKYGPLGHAVNLASRVEGATKALGVPVLLTGSTKALLGPGVETRRLCRVRVVGIAQPVDLFELPAGAIDDAWRARRDAYEDGLAHFEEGRLPESCRILYPILAQANGAYDVPTLTLVGRSIDHLRAPTRPFQPVLELSSK